MQTCCVIHHFVSFFSVFEVTLELILTDRGSAARNLKTYSSVDLHLAERACRMSALSQSVAERTRNSCPPAAPDDSALTRNSTRRLPLTRTPAITRNQRCEYMGIWGGNAVAVHIGNTIVWRRWRRPHALITRASYHGPTNRAATALPFLYYAFCSLDVPAARRLSNNRKSYAVVHT